jgi:hypothetical protein
VKLQVFESKNLVHSKESCDELKKQQTDILPKLEPDIHRAQTKKNNTHPDACREPTFQVSNRHQILHLLNQKENS